MSTYTISFLFPLQLSDERVDALVKGLGLTRVGEMEIGEKSIKLSLSQDLTDVQLGTIQQQLINSEILPKLVTVTRNANS